MPYSYQSGPKKRKKAQKEKQFLSNYAKHSSICNWIKHGNSSLPDPCQRGPGINVGTGPGLFSQRPYLLGIKINYLVVAGSFICS